jgi:hypothetical protein
MLTIRGVFDLDGNKIEAVTRSSQGRRRPSGSSRLFVLQPIGNALS